MQRVQVLHLSELGIALAAARVSGPWAVGAVENVQQENSWPCAIQPQIVHSYRYIDPLSLGLRLLLHFSPSNPNAHGAAG